MITTQQITNRLYEEWKTHGKICIAVDFDDTLYPYKIATQKDCDEVINILKECKQVGAYIVIHTACNIDRFNEIKQYCKDKGLEIDGINITPINVPYGKSGSKPYANIFIDDRAGINGTLEILQSVMIKIRSEKDWDIRVKSGDIEF